MLEFLLNLQLFADGDGGDGGASSEGEGTGADALDETMSKELASIPEKARKFYPKKAKTEAQGEAEEEEVTDESEEVSKPSYLDLIKSDEYKDAHKEYMEKTISDRLKRYKGIEERDTKMSNLLQTIGMKYGLDANSDTFLDDIAKAIDGDESYYEQYAIDHDMTPQEARKVVELEREVSQFKASREEAEREMQKQEALRVLRENAVRTKAQFPQFDLDTEMMNEDFRNITALLGGDTTRAYMAIHGSEVVQNVAVSASKQAQIQTANAISATKGRPTENGMKGSQGTVTETNFRSMNLQQLREYAESQKRMRR